MSRKLSGETVTSIMWSPKAWYWVVVVAVVIAAMVTGGPAILSAQTVKPSTVQKTDTTAAATEVEIQRRFNELRREFLDDRTDTINWWLTATAIFLTLIGVVVPIVGAIAAYFGFNRFRRIEEEARRSVDQARRSAEEAERHVKRIRERREQAEEYVQRIQRDSPEQTTTAYTPEYRDLDKIDDLALERAISDAYSLQEGGRIEEAIAKWRSIANVAEGTDNELAARAWFSVSYLLQEERHGESSGN